MGCVATPSSAASPRMCRWAGPANWPPTSTTCPSARRWFSTRPPTRSRASRTSTLAPARCSSRAAVRPARPAPTTTTSASARPAMPRVSTSGRAERSARLVDTCPDGDPSSDEESGRLCSARSDCGPGVRSRQRWSRRTPSPAWRSTRSGSAASCGTSLWTGLTKVQTRRATMNDPGVTRVAVYIDFDNIVISRYDQVHGRGQFQRDKVRAFDRADKAADPEVAEKLRRATVDVGAMIDFASSFGTLVLTRAYADWSDPVNADYRGQLVSRAVDLVQLFPTAAYAKNGADIRLAVDAVEDMFRLPDLTHVVIVAGDSDYVPLAERCRRLGRYVVAVGVAGSTSRALAAACDELVTYDALPGITPAEAPQPATTGRTAGARAERQESGSAPAARASRRTRRPAA